MKSIINTLATVFLLLSTTIVYSQNKTDLEKVYQSYFNLKDAFITSNEKAVSAKANLLLTEIGNVKMENLDGATHAAWMKALKNLNLQTNDISKANNIEKQRKTFASLSESIHSLMKVSK